MARIDPSRAWRCHHALARLDAIFPQPSKKIAAPLLPAADSKSPYPLVRNLLGLPEHLDAEKGENVYARLTAADFALDRQQVPAVQQVAARRRSSASCMRGLRRLRARMFPPPSPQKLCPFHILFLGVLVLLLGGTSGFAQAPPAPGSRFVVVLDAAHGGADGGAVLGAGGGKSEPEKAYTLALSIRLRSLLAARGIGVVTTRETDTELSPEQRATLANHAGAQACLVLHAAMTGSGVHLFISSLAAAPRTTFVPWRTAQAAWVQRSIGLAGTLNSALGHAGVKVTIGRTALTTIDSMTCPAVAVEVAPEQPAAHGRPATMDDDAYLAQTAEALAAGLLEWRAEGQNP